ncbi:MAG: hypothetical protein OJF49_000047 [Ktedonobacterales bacterium]|jgi:integrase|nr:MAG: hypothetical protein OJF49_000047 [Ktedonobacterales bacterium]
MTDNPSTSRKSQDANNSLLSRGDADDYGWNNDSTWANTSAQPRTWRDELPRWLATLNPGRTQHEYEKAVGYFFLTVGVPQELLALSFDLLLAYRGSLAIRAIPRERGAARTVASVDPLRTAIQAPQHARVDGASQSAPADHNTHEASSGRVGPLSPATVNIRLTALSRFLIHCVQVSTLPQLSVDQIHTALKRLHNDRRRPYQILAESEWKDFLAAAILPISLPSSDNSGVRNALPDSPELAALPHQRSPWGTPRTRRREAPSGLNDTDEVHTRIPKSRAGLTGEHTAQRDYALIALALATGLRAIELALLDVGDLVREWHNGQEEWWLVLPDLKTKGQHGGRTLPLAPDLIHTLFAYVRATGRRWEQPGDHATPLFLSRSTLRATSSSAESAELRTSSSSFSTYRRLSTRQIARIVDRIESQWLATRPDLGGNAGSYRMATGETRAISPHALRHSAAIALLEGNAAGGRPPASVEHVRGWLGHFDIRTTQGYLAHLESRQHRRPFTILPPIQPQNAESVPNDPGSQPGTNDSSDAGTA